jgi:hypothetical protein
MERNVVVLGKAMMMEEGTGWSCGEIPFLLGVGSSAASQLQGAY